MRDTIEMAREANIYFTDRLVDVISMEDLKRFEALVRADERAAPQAERERIKGSKPIGYAFCMGGSWWTVASKTPDAPNGTYILHASYLSDNVQFVGLDMSDLAKAIGETK
jgi:hypothetical protein